MRDCVPVILRQIQFIDFIIKSPEWIIFLCILRTQPKRSLGHQIKRKLVCPIHLVGVLQKVSVQSLIFLCLKSLQLRPIFLVLNIPTYCRDKSSKSLMNFIFCLFIPMKRHSSTWEDKCFIYI